MTNPNNAIGTNGAFGGRTSVNAFNDNLSAWTRGIMSGWACVPDSGMTVALGGDSSVRDVAIAEDDAGNKTSINNISLAPVQVTIPGAPASNTRIDSIVAYVDNPPQGTATITDNYESCGIIVVSGTATSSPVPPNESTIRSAITADGATGATAYYVVLANVSVANGTTDITSGEITAGDVAQLSGTGVVTANNVDFATYSTNEQIAGTWIDGKTIYKKTIATGPLPSTKNPPLLVPMNIQNLGTVVKAEGVYVSQIDDFIFFHNSPAFDVDNGSAIRLVVNGNNLQINIGGTDRSNCVGYITVYYTKTS